jgi:hypothetical protein
MSTSGFLSHLESLCCAVLPWVRETGIAYVCLPVLVSCFSLKLSLVTQQRRPALCVDYLDIKLRNNRTMLHLALQLQLLI